MSHKILIVEDEPDMRLGLKDNLEFEGFDVQLAENGVEGLKKLQEEPFDLILLDVMMPKMSGLDMCRKARERGISTPIIFLTAKGEEIDKVLGLEMGADDYITKPFGLREMLARVRAVLRRGKSDTGNKSVQLGKLEVDLDAYTARNETGEVKMTHKEFDIIRYLLKNKNKIVTRFELLEHVWGYHESPTTRTVDNFIVKLRHKIEADPNAPKIILTVHGTGYKLIDTD